MSCTNVRECHNNGLSVLDLLWCMCVMMMATNLPIRVFRGGKAGWRQCGCMHVQYAFVKMMVRVVLLSRNYSTLVWCGYDDSTNWCVKQETSDDEGGPYTYTSIRIPYFLFSVCCL